MSARGVTVVYLMAAEVMVDADGSRSAAVMVLNHGRCHAARNPLARPEQRLMRAAGIRRVEMRDVDVGIRRPVRREVVAQLEVSAVLLEAHARPMVVAAAVLPGKNAVKLAAPHAVGSFGLERAVRACAEVYVGLHAVGAHPARHYVDHSAHSV